MTTGGRSELQPASQEIKGSRQPQGKRRPWLGAWLVAVLIVLLAGGYYYSEHLKAPLSALETEPVKVTVPPGSSTREIGGILEQRKLIRNAAFFALYVRQSGLDQSLKAGDYFLRSSDSMDKIVAQLVAGGASRDKAVTIPEGYTVVQIASLFADKGYFAEDKVLEGTPGRGFPLFLDDGSNTGARALEGFLFPDTYRISAGMAAEDVISLMLNRFAKVFAELTGGEEMNLERVRELVTIASLVEREARAPAERQRIAGVIYNRLQRGMLLQVDATVLYAMGEHKQRLTYQDLEYNSPYNTYLHKGLPPGPIANPGRASLLAALEPEEHDFLYYVAKPDGTHHFSRTLQEHNRAKAQYR